MNDEGKRYPVAGAITGPIPSGTGIVGAAGPTENLLGSGITAGRTFWLRHAWFYNSQNGCRIMFSDNTTGATGPTGSGIAGAVFIAADNVRFVLELVSGPSTGLGSPQTVDFAPPGLKFSTGCVVSCDLTTSGVCAAGGAGYEE